MDTKTLEQAGYIIERSKGYAALRELLGLCRQLNAENLTLRAELEKLSRRVEVLDATTPVDDPNEEFGIEARLDSLERRVTAITNLLGSVILDFLD